MKFGLSDDDDLWARFSDVEKSDEEDGSNKKKGVHGKGAANQE